MTSARSLAWRLITDPVVIVAVGLTGAAAMASVVPTDPGTPRQKVEAPPRKTVPSRPPSVNLNEAPAQTALEMTVEAHSGRSIADVLTDSGANAEEAHRAASLVGNAAARPGRMALWLGEKRTDGTRPLLKLLARPSFDESVVVAPAGGKLRATRHSMTVDATPRRVRGRAGDGLYWSLRKAGVPASAAQEYLGAIAGRIEIGRDVSPDDQFDLVIDRRRSATGETRDGSLLYAALARPGRRSIELVRWTVQGRDSWLDPDQGNAVEEKLSLPSGTISSRFGYRFHPVLHRSRLHRGVDVRASYGTAVYAAGDGRVAAAGWAGGYGKQVRLDHDGAMTTSYSHLSRIVAEPGSAVRKGQLIGFVGSTGLSTGPHLHFEVMAGGRAVDPLGGTLSARRVIDPADRAALPVRLKQLLGIRPA